MLKLMRLEAQRINLRVYFFTALILGGILLLFAYFTANAARVTGENGIYELQKYSAVYLCNKPFALQYTGSSHV